MESEYTTFTKSRARGVTTNSPFPFAFILPLYSKEKVLSSFYYDGAMSEKEYGCYAGSPFQSNRDYYSIIEGPPLPCLNQDKNMTFIHSSKDQQIVGPKRR